MEDYIQRKNFSTTINKEMLYSCQDSDPLNKLFEGFPTITLAEMDKVKLMNRIDTKFLLNFNQLPCLLERALEHYKIVEINGEKISPYSSIYWDTEEADMYCMHHNRRVNRYKIRMRSYLNSDLSFLEIKQKNNKGRTSKKRIMIDNQQFQSLDLDESEQRFIVEKSPYSFDLLKPMLQNFFQRITLVDNDETERITIDIDLAYQTVDSSVVNKVEDLVIVEMKQSGNVHSYFHDYLRDLSITPRNMSKYCIGMVLSYPDLKNNRFKNKLRQINKITKKNYDSI